jgi:hypothetical protein
MAAFEVDLETSSILFDGSWLTADELSSRLTQAVAAKNFGGVGRLGEALEQLAQELDGAREIKIRISAADHARLTAAGQRMNQLPEVFARELLLQVLSSHQPAPAPLPSDVPTLNLSAAADAFEPPPVLDAPPPVVGDLSPEEAAAALEIKPKRKGSNPSVPPPVLGAPPPVVGNPPSVVVDLGPDERTTQPGQNRWFKQG